MCTQMARNNFGPMGSTSGEGLSDRVGQGTLPDCACYHHCEVSKCFPTGRGRGPGPTCETSSGDGTPLRGSIRKSSVSGTEEGWLTSSSYKFETSQWVRTEAALQDGRIGDGEGPATTRRLDVFLGSQGCVPLCLHCQGASQVPPLHMEWQDLRVHLPTLWTLQCSSNFHKVVEASNGVYASTGDEAHSVPGRHPADAPVQGISGTTSEQDSPIIGISGIHSEPGEIQSNTNTENPVLGLSGGFDINEVLLTRRESPRDQSHVPEPPTATQGDHPSVVSTIGQNDSSSTSSAVSPTPLPPTTAAQDQGIQKVRVIRHTGVPGSRSHTRPAVVERSPSNGEREKYQSTNPGLSDRERRLIDGLGCCLQRSEDWWPVVSPRTTTTYQHTGAEGRYVCSPGLREGQAECSCSSKDGQHLSPGICLSDGGNSIPQLDESSLRNVGLVSPEGCHTLRLSPARSEQPDSRLGVQGDTDISRVETQGGVIPQDLCISGPMQNRLVCQSIEQTAGPLHQLEARSRSHTNRCLSNQLEGTGGICISTLCSDRQVFTEGQSGTEHNSVGGTFVEEPSMVSNATRSSSRTSSSHPSLQRPAVRSQRATTSSSVLQQTEVNRLETIRQQNSAAGVSEETSALLLAGWSTGTNSAYQSGWKRWSCWCQRREIDPVLCGVQPFLDFITSLFEEGLEYRTINLIRSAVSSTHRRIEGIPIGQHPLVKQLFKGVYNSRPPQPRYSSTWDVNVVLDYITKLGENKDLPLKQLSFKLLMLMCLVSANRISELHALDLRFRYHKPNGVLFKLASLTKKRQTGAAPKECFFASFPEDKLCVVQCLKEYEKVTQQFREVSSDKPAPLFLSYVKPHSSVTAQRMAHWVKDLLKVAGVDTNVFKAHSVRGASTSAALKKGVHLKDILETADWSNESTFKRFYYRSSEEDSFARRVLSRTH